MRFSIAFTIAASLAGFVAALPTESSNVTEIAARASCSTPLGSGTCVKTSSCTSTGFNVAGYCPGAANVQCCIKKTCKTSQGSGLCLNTGDGCSGGSFFSGACPGPSSVKCCVKGASSGGGSGGCGVPSTPNYSVAEIVYKTAKARKVSDKVLLATFETAWVESHVNNLSCGDRDSVGVFQQRAGWGTFAQRTNVAHATTSFLNKAISVAKAHPGYTAGQIAQKVQVSAFPARYDAAKAKAQSIIAHTKARLA
ncbi:hypothetical protein BKA62DRAFT_311376 [Auriculariales sp. MPI-PUGE-AT-0066]|nr:hypothetical protein BKA62DRAFT_311376 [Auriculariales sp. MPI-PUGE-AT-0066]